MCGRFVLAGTPEAVASAFGLSKVDDFPPRYNIAPSQPIAIIRQNQASGRRELCLQRWGLIPSWAKDATIGSKLINARSETAAEKPSFRTALKYRRCLIPATGFYEWQAIKGKGKQPFFFSMMGNSLFAFAGLWESWHDIETCTILTTAANSLLQPIHDRMPVILPAEAYDQWLDPTVQDTKQVAQLLQPFPDESMQAFPVSTRVNSVKVDDASCMEPLPAS
ncbi:MAG TPA: SOS response-associated peptidase [Stenomitos sp.]